MQWEYHMWVKEVKGFFSHKINQDELTANLNWFGQQGWELVNSYDTNEFRGETSRLVFIFKRPMQQSQQSPPPLPAQPPQ